MNPSFLRVALLTVLLGSIVLPAKAEVIYWTDAGTIYRATPDGSGVTPVLSSFADQIAIDMLEARVYFTGDLPLGGPGPTGRVWRANLDGSAQQTLVLSPTAPAGVALDPTGVLTVIPWMFWADGVSIQRANHEGSTVQPIVTGQTSAFGVAFDATARKVYWTRNSADTTVAAIERADIDGKNREKLIFANGPVSGIALDPVAGKMYWGYVNPDIDGLFAGMIERSNLDGTQVESVVSGLINPIGLALDPTGGWLYWTDTGGSLGRGSVMRAHLDGSGAQKLASDLTNPRGIAIDSTVPEPGVALIAGVAVLFLVRRVR